MATKNKTKLANDYYWKVRAVINEKLTHNIAKDGYNEITKAFDDAKNEIQAKIDSWYARLADNNGISIDLAHQLLDNNSLKEFKWDVKQYIKYGQENAINQKWMKELENASAKVHINRLEALKVRIDGELLKAYGKEDKVVNESINKSYKDRYYRTAYDIQKGFNVGFEVGINEDKLKAIVKRPWTTDGKEFSSRIWNNKNKMVNELYQQCIRLAMVGNDIKGSINLMTKYVDSSVENAKYSAKRLLQTETAYFASEGQKACFNDLDVEKYEIVATLDRKTSKICRSMDGKVFAMKDFKAGETAPPFHPNCRSTTCPYFDEDFSLGERAARGEDGKTYYVPSDMTYKEWVKNQGKNNNKSNTNNKKEQEKNQNILQNGKNNVILYRHKGTSNNRTNEDRVIVSKPMFNKLMKPILKKGATYTIAKKNTDEYRLLDIFKVSASTLGTSITFREDVTISDVLEERQHVIQNMSGKFDKYEHLQHEVMTEIEAKEVLISLENKYNIPQKEREETRYWLNKYKEKKEEMIENGQWKDDS